MYELHGYQKRAIEFACDCPQNYQQIDLGMGKTAINLRLIQKMKQKAFVFAPLRPLYSTWPTEIKLWAPELSYAIVHGKNKFKALNSGADILLMNYEGLPWLAKQRGKWQKRMVIFDEMSMCKSHSTTRFKLLKQMFPMWNGRHHGLSATPKPNSSHDLWSQYYLLDKGVSLGHNITTFRNDYCQGYSYPGMTVTLYKVRPQAEVEIYNKIAPITFRLDAQDYLDMPPITYNIIPTRLSPKLMKAYKTLEYDLFLAIDGKEYETPNAAVCMGKLRQFVQGGLYDENKQWNPIHSIKLDTLDELIGYADGPILCPIQFKGELAMIRKMFPNAPVIAGGTTAIAAAHYIDQWNAGELPLLLCHPASISHGVNLQAGGHTILWYGLPWSLEQYMQLNGRVYRQGQQRGVVINILLMEDTVDEAVYEALQSKARGQEAMFKHLKAYMARKSY